MTTLPPDLREAMEGRVALCREQVKASPYSHTIAAGWYAEDVPALLQRLMEYERVVEAARIAYDGFGEDDHRFYGSQKRLAEALAALSPKEKP